MPTTGGKRIQELSMLLAKRGDYIRFCQQEIKVAESDVKLFEEELTKLQKGE